LTTDLDKYIFKFAPVVIVSCILMFRIKNISYCYSVTFLVMVALLQNGYCKPSAQLKESSRDVRSIATDLAGFLAECWNNFVQKMSTGIPNLEIPIFDPWLSNSIPFQLQDSDLKASATFNSTSVESAGFSDATMIPQQQNDLNYLINLSRLTIRGKYDVSGNYHYLFPVYGYGSFEILLHDVIGIMNTTVYSTYGKSDQCLVTITLDSFSYKMFSSSFDNLSGFGTDTATRSKFIVAMTKTLWPIIDEQMRSQLSVSLTEYYNDQLQQLKGFSNTFIVVQPQP